MSTILETERLVLRPWKESDAESLYEYAKHPAIGPIAGWPVHTSVENSLQIIREVFNVDETYAVTHKGDDVAIGSIGLIIGDKSDLGLGANEAELGYWIGKPFWGQGFIPEASREIIRHAFEDLALTTLWCGYFEENDNSKRVAEKCGFTLQRIEKDKEFSLVNAVKTQCVTRLTKDQWQEQQEKRCTHG